MYGRACNQITTHDYNVSGTRNSSSGPGGNPASILAGNGKSTCHKGSMVAGITLIPSACHLTRVLLSAFQYSAGYTDTCSSVQGLVLLPSDPSRLMAPLHIQIAHASFIVAVLTFEDLPPAYAPLLLRTYLKMWLFTPPFRCHVFSNRLILHVGKFPLVK